LISIHYKGGRKREKIWLILFSLTTERGKKRKKKGHGSLSDLKKRGKNQQWNILPPIAEKKKGRPHLVGHIKKKGGGKRGDRGKIHSSILDESSRKRKGKNGLRLGTTSIKKKEGKKKNQESATGPWLDRAGPRGGEKGGGKEGGGGGSEKTERGKKKKKEGGGEGKERDNRFFIRIAVGGEKKKQKKGKKKKKKKVSLQPRGPAPKEKKERVAVHRRFLQRGKRSASGIELFPQRGKKKGKVQPNRREEGGGRGGEGGELIVDQITGIPRGKGGSPQGGKGKKKKRCALIRKRDWSSLTLKETGKKKGRKETFVRCPLLQRKRKKRERGRKGNKVQPEI